MGKITLRFVFMVLLLIFGMLMGMNVAENGLNKVSGISANPEGLQVSQKNDQIEVKVMGKTYTSELPSNNGDKKSNKTDEKQKEMNSTSDVHVNIISNLGNHLGSLLQVGAEKGIDVISNLIK